MDEQSAIARLRETLAPGDTVYTVLRHVSRSGMSRAIDVYKLVGGGRHWLSPAVAAVGVGRWSDRYEAVNMGGAGMDMGFALVYDLSFRLFPDGYPCIGENCPANDHSNGDRDYTPGHAIHEDGGYALRQAWL